MAENIVGLSGTTLSGSAWGLLVGIIKTSCKFPLENLDDTVPIELCSVLAPAAPSVNKAAYLGSYVDLSCDAQGSVSSMSRSQKEMESQELFGSVGAYESGNAGWFHTVRLQGQSSEWVGRKVQK